MFIFRVLSLVVIAAALMLLGADALSSLESGEMHMRSFSEALDLVNPGLAGSFQAWSENTLSFASPVLPGLMSAPAWIPVGIIGLVLAFLFRIRD